MSISADVQTKLYEMFLSTHQFGIVSSNLFLYPNSPHSIFPSKGTRPSYPSRVQKKFAGSLEKDEHPQQKHVLPKLRPSN